VEIGRKNERVKTRLKGPLGRPRHRWEVNIRTNLWGIGWEGMDWIRLVDVRDQWRAVVNTIMNFRVP